jgi:DNA-binding transcriptional LysR family regulator
MKGSKKEPIQEENPMLTFKQLEALHWIVELGGFSPAATKLHTTRSAISKRVQGLESLFRTELFDRSERSARLTERGEEMLLAARKLLEHRDVVIEQFSRAEAIERRLRLGVTELTALTWLPRLVDAIEGSYPKVVIEPHVDDSVDLREKLLADEVDVIVVPDAFSDTRFASKVVGKVQSAWMCKPGVLDASKPVRLSELSRHRLLVQGDKSGTGLTYARWLKTHGVQPQSTIASNNLIAMIGMTVSGLGISYLPLQCLSGMLAAGQLHALKVKPALPPITYVALCKRDQRGRLLASVVRFAQQTCDFGAIFQAES